eukprot:18035-Prymnesium_polylepis.1
MSRACWRGARLQDLFKELARLLRHVHCTHASTDTVPCMLLRRQPWSSARPAVLAEANVRPRTCRSAGWVRSVEK